MSIHAHSVQQQILRLISQIQCEDIRQTRENRESNRQKLTLPVTIKLLNDGSEIDAVSRDLSSSGIGLIASANVEPEALGELEIELENSTHTVFSRCLWCKPFGKGYFISGWKFESVL